MDRQILKASGWKSLRDGLFDFYKCPGCGYLSEEIMWGHDGNVLCPNCDNSFRKEAFTQVKEQATFVVCSECGEEMPLTEWRLGFIGYLCDCDNYVAIPFEGQSVNPREILQLGWNEELSKSGLLLAGACSVATCETPRDWQVLYLLQVIAKQENSEFRFASEPENDALLAFDPASGSYIGYLLWYEDHEKKMATLNQLFTLPAQRRKGYAEAMVKYWVHDVAKKIEETFAVESPNEKTLALLLKLGYIREEGDQYVGIGCVFTQGF